MQHGNIVKCVIASTVIATIARFIQIFSFTEGATGFTKIAKSAMWGQTITFLVIILAVCIPLIVTTLFSKRQPVRTPKLSKSPKFAIMGYICSAVFVANAVLLLLSSAISTTVLLGGFLNLLSGAAIALYSTTAIAKVKFPSIIMVAPVLLFVYLLVEKFISFNGMTTIIENIFTMLYLSLQLVFFLAHGKLISSVNIRKSSRQILTLSALVLVFSAMCSVPNLLVFIVGRKDLVHESALNISYLVYGIYSFLYSSVVYAKRQMPSSGVPSVKKLDITNAEKTDTSFLLPTDEIH